VDHPSTHFTALGRRADRSTEEYRRVVEAWGEKATPQGWTPHLHLSKEVNELIDQH
jgi:hypothetical protein